ncbi:MAG: hypothetical protein GY757_04855 [bacterium]|nr:hypothetical protein [bacterium]
MSNVDLKKEVDILNNTFKKTGLLKVIKETVKGSDFSLGLVVFLSPSTDGLTDKKQLKAFKEKRKLLQKFFKDDGKKIPLRNNHFLMDIPEQLAKVIKASCISPGFNRKSGFGPELFALVAVEEKKRVLLPELLKTLLLLNTAGSPECFNPAYGAHIYFSDNKLKQIVPLELPGSQTADTTQPGSVLPSPVLLKEFGVTCKNYGSLDHKIQKELDTGLNYLEKIQRERDSYIKLSLIFSALDFFMQTSSLDNQSESRSYFVNICKDLASKIGWDGKKELFEKFFKLRIAFPFDTSHLKSGINEELEMFYRDLLKKMINDGKFVKTALPKLKTSQKRELKKKKVKKRWRRFPGKHIARLFNDN